MTRGVVLLWAQNLMMCRKSHKNYMCLWLSTALFFLLCLSITHGFSLLQLSHVKGFHMVSCLLNVDLFKQYFIFHLLSSLFKKTCIILDNQLGFMMSFPFLHIFNAFRRWEKCLKFSLSVSSSYSKTNQLTTSFSLQICGSFTLARFLFVNSKIYVFLND